MHVFALSIQPCHAALRVTACCAVVGWVERSEAHRRSDSARRSRRGVPSVGSTDAKSATRVVTLWTSGGTVTAEPAWQSWGRCGQCEVRPANQPRFARLIRAVSASDPRWWVVSLGRLLALQARICVLNMSPCSPWLFSVVAVRTVAPTRCGWVRHRPPASRRCHCDRRAARLGHRFALPVRHPRAATPIKKTH